MPVAITTILAALGGLAFLGGVFVILVRVVIAPAMAAYIAEKDLEYFRKALRGAIALAEPIVSLTPTDIDNVILEKFVKPAMAEFEKVRGKKAPMPASIATNVVKGMLVSASTGVSPVAVSVGTLSKLDLKARP